MKIRVLTYLSVSVWEIIADVCKLANIDIPTIKELEEKLDDKTLEIYEKGLTCTINQVDSDYATNLMKNYKSRNVAEMCAFVASIRPGFKSLLDNFIERKPYTTNIPELDDLLKESYHYLMYQESIMKYLIWLGIPEDETYGIIKKISKKKFKEEELKELKNKLHKNWIKIVGSEQGFEETWQVVEDASRYSFNASHSLSYAYDSLYGAYLKAHYPLEYYTVVLNKYSGDMKRTTKLIKELDYFGIKFETPKFGYAKSDYFFDKESNTIFKGVESVKYLNEESANFLYQLSQEKEYTTFTDVLIDCNKKVDFRKMEILVKIGYFSRFGGIKKLLNILYLYSKKHDKSTMSKVRDIELYVLYKDIAEKHASKITQKTLTIDYKSFIKDVELSMKDEDVSDIQKMKYEEEYMGNILLTIDKNANKNECIVVDINTDRYNPKVMLFCLYSGNTKEFNISKKLYEQLPFNKFEKIYLYKFENKYKKKRQIDGSYITTKEIEPWILDYEVEWSYE